MKNEDVAVYCQGCGAYLPQDKTTEYMDVLKALLLGLTVTGCFYVLYLPVSEYYQVRELFSGRISEIITALTAWSLFMIVLKYFRYREQNRAFQQFRNQKMNSILSQGIYVRTADECLGEISEFLQEQKIKKYQNSVIFRRIRRIFHHIKAIPKKEEINKIFDYQAQIDFNRTENSYSMLNVFIWAIPILGFIGTVFGIGEAIGEFSGFIRSVNSVELGTQMRSALGGVTSGLSLAFNTTFLALMCVIPIMVLSSFLRKAEEDLLLMMEEYCLEEVLPHLHIVPGSEVEREAFDEHMQKIMQLSGNWIARLEPLIDSVTNYAGSLKHQVEGLQPMVREFSEAFFTTKDAMVENTDPSLNANERSRTGAELPDGSESSDSTMVPVAQKAVVSSSSEKANQIAAVADIASPESPRVDDSSGKPPSPESNKDREGTS